MFDITVDVQRWNNEENRYQIGKEWTESDIGMQYYVKITHFHTLKTLSLEMI